MRRFLLFSVSVFTVFSSIAQVDTIRTIDSLLAVHCEAYHVDGFFQFKENTMKPGEPILLYNNYLPGNVLNDFVL